MDTWRIYPRYSEFESVSKKIRTTGNGFPYKYKLQYKRLSEFQLDERQMLLENWMLSIVDSMNTDNYYTLEELDVLYAFFTHNQNVVVENAPDWAIAENKSIVERAINDDQDTEANSSSKWTEYRRFVVEAEGAVNRIHGSWNSYLKSMDNFCAAGQCFLQDVQATVQYVSTGLPYEPKFTNKEHEIDIAELENVCRQGLKQMLLMQEMILENSKNNKIKQSVDRLRNTVYAPIKEKYWENVPNRQQNIELNSGLSRQLAFECFDLQKETIDVIHYMTNMAMTVKHDMGFAVSTNMQDAVEASPDKTKTKTDKDEQMEPVDIEQINKNANVQRYSHEEEEKHVSWAWGKLPERSAILLRPTPMPLIKGQTVVQMEVAAHYLLCLTDVGCVYYYDWADSNRARTNSLSSIFLKDPVLVSNFTLDKALHGKTITKIAAGAHHCLAMTNTGEVYSWGSGEDGRLGHGDIRDRSMPRKIAALLKHGIVDISCGGAHTLFLSNAGVVFACGRGKNGRLGLEDCKLRDIPTIIKYFSKDHNIEKIECGWNFSIAFSVVNQKVYAWGKQGEGQCGIGFQDFDVKTPKEVPTLTNKEIVSVACGYSHSIALTANGVLFSFGLGEYGQLGTGQVYQAEPRLIEISENEAHSDKIVQVFCGAFHSSALSEHGAVFSWGLNIQGACGLGNTKNIEQPQYVARFDNVQNASISMGDSYSILLGVVHPKKKEHGSLSSMLLDQEQMLNKANHIKKHEKEQELRKARRIWRSKILPDWGTNKTSKLAHYYWRLGIPPSIRSKVWPLAIGNSLKITPDMYLIYRRRAERQRKYFGTQGDDHQSVGSDALAIGREFTLQIIHTDLPRTFPALGLFDDSGPYYTKLLELLETYACYRPDLGYIQGMSYFAAMLCLYIPEDSVLCFQCLANLMVNQHLFTFYLMDVELTEPYYRIFQKILRHYSAKLYSHLESMEVKPSMYLMNWLQTLFLQILPLEIASRVWDCYLLDGTIYLFRVALGIISLLESKLLDCCCVEECLPILQKSVMYHDLWKASIQEEALFKAIDRIQIPGEIYAELEQVVSDTFFYSKTGKYAFMKGKSVCVQKLKSESRSMYKLSDSMNNLLGGY